MAPSWVAMPLSPFWRNWHFRQSRIDGSITGQFQMVIYDQANTFNLKFKWSKLSFSCRWFHFVKWRGKFRWYPYPVPMPRIKAWLPRKDFESVSKSHTTSFRSVQSRSSVYLKTKDSDRGSRSLSAHFFDQWVWFVTWFVIKWVLTISLFIH